MSLTTDPNDPRLKEGQSNPEGQHSIYLVLSEEERAKGFVRPFRNAYVHVGKKVNRKDTVIPLEEAFEGPDDSARQHYSRENGYVAYMK